MARSYRHIAERLSRVVATQRMAHNEGLLLCEARNCEAIGAPIRFPGIPLEQCPVACSDHAGQYR